MLTERAHPWLAGALAGGLMCLALLGYTGRVFAFFLPFLPLAYVAVRLPVDGFSRAALAAAVTAVLGGGGEALGFMVFMFLVPMGYLASVGNHRTVTPQGVLWWPVDRALPALTVYAAALFALGMTIVSTQAGGLVAMVNALMQEAVDAGAEIPPEMRETMQRAVFAFLPVMMWCWLAMIPLAVMLMRFLLDRRRAEERPSWRPAGMLPPRWFLAAVTACGAALLVAGGDAGLIMRMVFVILLFPYFTFGACWVHSRLSRGGGHLFALGMFYLAVVVLVWPAWAVAAGGLVHHAVTLARSTGRDAPGQDS